MRHHDFTSEDVAFQISFDSASSDTLTPCREKSPSVARPRSSGPRTPTSFQLEFSAA
jgi:hypothetical protein